MAKLLGRIWAGKVWPLTPLFVARPTLPRDSDISLSEESTDELKINSQYRIKYSVTTAKISKLGGVSAVKASDRTRLPLYKAIQEEIEAFPQDMTLCGES